MNHETPLPLATNQERLPRRTVLKWLAAAAAATQFQWPAAEAKPLPDFGDGANAGGYGGDPDLSRFYSPGDFWPLTFTPEQKSLVIALADLVLPADHLGPAASEVRVPDYIDEWVSAPYPEQQRDRASILAGLEWLEGESRKRFQQGFAALKHEQRHAIAEDICGGDEVKPEFKKGAAFFQKFRNLAASAYYGTEAGWKAIGYVGNVPLVTFEGPQQEVLEKLGVEQTVK